MLEVELWACEVSWVLDGAGGEVCGWGAVYAVSGLRERGGIAKRIEQRDSSNIPVAFETSRNEGA